MDDNSIKGDVKNLYDSIGEDYGETYQTPAGSYFMMRKIKTALSLGRFEKGSSLLEIGCANGAYTLEFAKLGYNMTGYDLSTECIKSAKEEEKKYGFDSINYLVGDAEDLSSIPDNSFDGVISFSCLRYVPNPQKAINEIYRVLKKDKHAVVDFPNSLSPWFKVIKPLLRGEGHIHDHQYSTSKIKSFFQTAGFSDLQVKRILYTPKATNKYLVPISKIVDKIGELPLLNNFSAIIMCSGKKI